MHYCYEANYLALTAYWKSRTEHSGINIKVISCLKHVANSKVPLSAVSQAGGSPPCVNGDIAIQSEWSNFDPSQNPNPLTDYDKTLHN